ncbi:MAG: high-potential iron-sulfur protein [Saprospiraceae bacterium]
MTVFFGFILAACRPKSPSAEAESKAIQSNACDDLSSLNEAEKTLRQTFGYVRESPVADNHCNNCNLWIPNESDKACGKCLLFKGPVYATGYCTYWAPQL